MTRVLAALLLLAAPQEPRYPPLAIGAAAPDFDLPGADGKRHALKDFASAKLLLVLFDTVHCPTSQNYEERIRKIHADYSAKGVALVAISPNDPVAVRLDELGYTDLDDSLESMKLRAADHKIPWTWCFDGAPNAVSQAYGPKATPHAFLFDAERRLRYQGGIDDHENPAKAKTPHLRNALDALLEGKPVPVAETRVFGCSTKWPHKRAQTEEYNARIAAEAVDLVPGGDLDGVLRAGAAAGKVRLVHYWKHSDPSRLAAMATMHHMYRRRNFELVTVALEADGKREDVLKALQKVRPAISAKNVVIADAGPPRTVLLSETGEELFRAEGGLDELACRRAIVRHLREDRLR
jgi:hypothetical protein